MVRYSGNFQPRGHCLTAEGTPEPGGSRTRRQERPLVGIPTIYSPASHVIYLYLSRGIHLSTYMVFAMEVKSRRAHPCFKQIPPFIEKFSARKLGEFYQLIKGTDERNKLR